MVHQEAWPSLKAKKFFVGAKKTNAMIVIALVLRNEDHVHINACIIMKNARSKKDWIENRREKNLMVSIRVNSEKREKPKAIN